ncbi:MAG TPA: hypothetical protein VN577_10470 [Terriglobales bacterium]|nr:hypothetical protein [Terriglobales bacterium]
MKIGAENSKKTMVAIGLFLVALVLTIRMIAGSFSSSPAQPATTTSTSTATTRGTTRTRTAARGTGRVNVKQNTAGPVTPNLDPRLRLDVLHEVESIEYSGDGRNIFLAHAEPAVEIPKPKASGFKNNATPQQVVNTPPPPPPPPPINLKFFGFASQQGSTKRIFLSSGDDIFVASEGEIVQRRYKIVKVNPNSIEVQDVLSNNRQTIPLTAG